jgi:hypothetical protein
MAMLVRHFSFDKTVTDDQGDNHEEIIGYFSCTFFDWWGGTCTE